MAAGEPRLTLDVQVSGNRHVVAVAGVLDLATADTLETRVMAQLRPDVSVLPARTADGAEQDGVGVAARVERLARQRLADRVDRSAAEQVPLDLQVERQCVEHAQRLGRDLRADAIAGETDDPHPVVAPSDADPTSCAYFASTPLS